MGTPKTSLSPPLPVTFGFHKCRAKLETHRKRRSTSMYLHLVRRTLFFASILELWWSERERDQRSFVVEGEMEDGAMAVLVLQPPFNHSNPLFTPPSKSSSISQPSLSPPSSSHQSWSSGRVGNDQGRDGVQVFSHQQTKTLFKSNSKRVPQYPVVVKPDWVQYATPH